MKSYRLYIISGIFLAAAFFFFTAAVVAKIRRADDLISKNRAIWKDGSQLQLEEAQWEQIDSAVTDSIIPGFELDRMWSEEQIADMREEGVLIECNVPETMSIHNQTLLKYTVISNEQYQYLIILTDTGTETYDLPEIVQAKLQEIISD